MDLIIYHNNCPDGWAAAYIAKMKYPEAELMPRDHGLEPPYDEVTGKDVLVVDFSWRTKEQNRKMASLAKSFLILDHHKTAEAELTGEFYAIFDMKRSGAGLTWDYLFGKDSPEENWSRWEGIKAFASRPWWVDYVEDRDLWNWKLEDSKAVNSYIMTFPYDIESWNKITSQTVKDALTLGYGAEAQVDKYVREAVKQAQFGSLNGKTIAVLNVPYLNCSEVGAELAKTNDVSLTWFERSDGMIQFSLRSVGDIDVSEIAKGFKGGGHKNASGFQLSLFEGRKIIDGILDRHTFPAWIPK